MSLYVDQRLQEWAEWSRMRIDGFYGIGGVQFGYDEPMPGAGRGYVKMPSKERCLETEEAIAWLRKNRETRGCRLMADALILHYRDHPDWSNEVKAIMLGLSRMSLHRNLERGRSLLLEYFLDRCFGPAPQTEQLRRDRRARTAIENISEKLIYAH